MIRAGQLGEDDLKAMGLIDGSDIEYGEEGEEEQEEGDNANK